MAGILQLRRGLKSTYISEGTNLAEAFFVTENNSLLIGTSGSVGDDVITLAKLSMANKDNTLAEANTGSFWITNDYTGSHMYLSNNLTASYAWFKNDVRIDGHLIMGDDRPIDVVTVKSHFSGSLIPDNDSFGTQTSSMDDGYHDLGSDSQRWQRIYLTANSPTDFLSGSNIDLTGKIKVDGEGRFGTLRVDDLTNDRILIAGIGGEVEDDRNLTYNGQNLKLGGANGTSDTADYYQTGSWQVSGSGEIDALTVRNLNNDRITFTKSNILQDAGELTWNGSYVGITGGLSASQDISVDREAYLASAIVKDLTEDRLVFAGVNGELEDSPKLTYNDIQLNVGEGNFTVQQATGNTFTSGTLHTDGQATLASANIEDLTNNRVVIVGTDGELEDDENFTFDATELNIGTGNFTVQQSSGNTQIVGTLDVDAQSTLASLNVEDLTSGRVVLAGTDGEIEDSENLTFDGSLLTVTGDTIITGNLTVTGDTTTLNVGELVVEDKNIVIASGALDSTAANGAGITIEGANANLTYESSNDWFTFNKDAQVQGDLYVTNDISSSTVNGIGNVEIYSASVDSRLDYLEGPFSTSVDSRLDDAEWTGSNHETRVIDLESTGSNHEQRIDSIESISGSLLYSASNDFSEIQLNKIDGTTLELDVTPRKVIESVINKNGFLPKGSPVYVSGSTGNALHVFAASASRADRMPATFILDQDLNADEEGYGILSGFINGVDTSLFEEGDNVYVGEDGGYTNQRPSGSNLLVQKLGNVVKKAINGSGVITGAGRANDVPNIQQGHLWVGNSDGVAKQYTTSSLIPHGTVSGSDQVSSSFEQVGRGILSSSNETFEEFSSSLDSRIDAPNLQSFISSSTYTILDADNKSTIFLSSSTDIAVTIDTLTTPNFECNLYNLGSTTASFQDGTATVGYPDGTKLEQDKVAALTRVMETDIYKLKGELN